MGARLRLWGGWDHPDEGGEGKSVIMTELTELRYDRRFGANTVIQFGLQKVDWSVTDGMGPSVMFAPRDLRFGLVGDPEDMTLPVESIVARYTMNYTHDVHLEFALFRATAPWRCVCGVMIGARQALIKGQVYRLVMCHGCSIQALKTNGRATCFTLLSLILNQRILAALYV